MARQHFHRNQRDRKASGFSGGHEMSATIYEFPNAVRPAVIVEQHISRVRPPKPAGAWLSLRGDTGHTPIPHVDLYPNGRFSWSFDDGPFDLAYSIAPIPMPEWFAEELDRNVPGDWFLLTINDCDGRGLAGIPLRMTLPRYRPEPYCPRCTSYAKGRGGDGDNYIAINLDTWEVGCRECLEVGGTVFHARYSPPRRTPPPARAKCAKCGFLERAPIHNAAVMRGNAVWHEFVPESLRRS